MIVVCSLREAQRQIDLHGASHAVSILGPETPHHAFSGIEGFLDRGFVGRGPVLSGGAGSFGRGGLISS